MEVLVETHCKSPLTPEGMDKVVVEVKRLERLHLSRSGHDGSALRVAQAIIAKVHARQGHVRPRHAREDTHA